MKIKLTQTAIVEVPDGWDKDGVDFKAAMVVKEALTNITWILEKVEAINAD